MDALKAKLFSSATARGSKTGTHPQHPRISWRKLWLRSGRSTVRLLRGSALAAIMAMTAVAVMAPAGAQAQISIGISVNFAPPPLPVYEQPPIVEADDMWIPGYWAWDDDDYDYYWVPGTWAQAPQPGLLWTPAWWEWSNGNYAFHEGYWAEHIGYYGGVVYGHGYDGSGYEGGYWQSNHFYYNRSVNNITNVNITNVYTKTMIVNGSPTASFNGPGGATVRPTPQQTAYAQESHTPPTSLQTQHVRAAAAMPALRASANHGAPPIAATDKPAAFEGAGVVKAARAGGDYHPPAAAVQRQAQVHAAHGEGAAPAAPVEPHAPDAKPAPAAAPEAPKRDMDSHTTDVPPAHTGTDRTGADMGAPPAKPEVKPEVRPTPAPKPVTHAAPARPKARPAPPRPAGHPRPQAAHAPQPQKAPPPHDDKRKDQPN